MAIITLLTDFGSSDGYAAAMKGVILEAGPGLSIVDAGHDLLPQDVEQAAWVLGKYWNFYPEGTIHVAVVDPGVGTSRAILLAELDGRRFLVPDNGLLTFAASRASRVSVRRLSPGFGRPGGVSATFHGRDIFAYAAGLLAAGTEVPSEPVDEGGWVRLPAVMLELGGEALEGRVMHVDRFGNLETNLHESALREIGWPAVRVVLDQHEISRIVRTYGEAETGDAVALVGSSGNLEISLVNGSAAAELEAGRSSRVMAEKIFM